MTQAGGAEMGPWGGLLCTAQGFPSGFSRGTYLRVSGSSLPALHLHLAYLRKQIQGKYKQRLHLKAIANVEYL